MAGQDHIFAFSPNFTIPDYIYYADNTWIHELTHCLMFRNLSSKYLNDNNMLFFAEGLATYVAYCVECDHYNPKYAQFNINMNLNAFNKQSEIDSALENNAEEYLASFIQKDLGDPEFQNVYIAGLRFVSYLCKTYGIDIIKDLLDKEKFSDSTNENIYSNFIDMLKEKTSSTLFEDFSEWYKVNKSNFVKIAIDINGEKTSIVTTASYVKDFYPSVIKKEYGLDRNFVDYCIMGNYILETEKLVIDYSNAIAIAQLFGMKIKGIALNEECFEYLHDSVTYEFYDAYGNLVYKGPTKRFFGGIQKYTDGIDYLIAYGVVKIVVKAEPGTQVSITDLSSNITELLVDQE
ncbi:hypothetical protein SDC9_102169 [bioreactor metagenome]|uniref:Uncharacterized protein n=1 Tax=bioreactor metagenome TaxID=1076179 RepID=A0A645B0U7_9ZZZZ